MVDPPVRLPCREDRSRPPGHYTRTARFPPTLRRAHFSGMHPFLSPGGNGWALFADSYARNGTVDNLGRLLKAAKAAGLPVLISPHYFYPTDKDWTAPGGATEVLMAQL